MEKLIVQVSYDPILNMAQQINLPEEYLDKLIQENHNFPFFFKIEDEAKQEKFYSSVLQFSSEESIIEIPYVIANQFHHMQSGSVVEISFLSKILFCKDLQIEPMTENFFSIPDSDRFLEERLSKLSILYHNQIFYITDENDTTYGIKVLKIEPDFEETNFSDFNTENQSCYSIVNQDINVDIVNKFEIERYYVRERQKKKDRVNEEKELKAMKKEDINVNKLGVKLSNQNEQVKTYEEIRQARLARFASMKKQQDGKKKNEN